MLINVLVGFVLPWVTILPIIRLHPVFLFTILPFTALISVIGNQVGMQLGWFWLNPDHFIPLSWSLFIDLGYNPAAAVWFTYVLHFNKWKRWAAYLTFLIVLNGLEYVAVMLGKVEYSSAWNIYLTFSSYLIGLVVIDTFFTLYKRWGKL